MEKGVVSTIKLKMIHKEETTLEVVMTIQIVEVAITEVAMTTKIAIQLRILRKVKTTLEAVMIIKIKIVEATGVAITTKTTIKIIVL